MHEHTIIHLRSFVSVLKKVGDCKITSALQGYYAWNKHHGRRTMSSLSSTGSLGSSILPPVNLSLHLFLALKSKLSKLQPASAWVLACFRCATRLPGLDASEFAAEKDLEELKHELSEDARNWAQACQVGRFCFEKLLD